MPTMSERTLLTPREVAEKYRVSIHTVRAWVSRGELKKFLQGDRFVLVDDAEVAALIQRKRSIREAE